MKGNSHECSHYGRKLSNVCVPEINVSSGNVYIGSVQDDQIYYGECLPDGEEMLTERVTITLDTDIHIYEIDLEDVLRFAAKHCRGIYDRVGAEEGQ